MNKIEVCAANLRSALAAQAGGGHRIELCSGLDLGGLTPSPGLIWEACDRLDIPVCVLIRPREGDFCYDAAETAQMLNEIMFCSSAGAAGVVAGALTPAGALDIPLLESLREAAEGMELVFHRAFDFVPDPFETLETLIDLGFDRILTSGQAPTAWEGRALLRDLTERADGRITIMPGSGINERNIGELAAATGAAEFHLSAKTTVKSPATVHDLPGLAWDYAVSDAAAIQRIVLGFK